MKTSHFVGDGSEQITTESVEFVSPFTLGKSPETYPAGAYKVETLSESLDTTGRAVLVRRRTTLIIPTASGFKCREVVAEELEEALARDAAVRLSEPSENPDREKVGRPA